MACQCMAIILQLTETEKNLLVTRYMDENTSLNHMLKYNLKSKLNHKNHKFYAANQYVKVEDVSLPIVGSPKQKVWYTLKRYI